MTHKLDADEQSNLAGVLGSERPGFRDCINDKSKYTDLYSHSIPKIAEGDK